MGDVSSRNQQTLISLSYIFAYQRHSLPLEQMESNFSRPLKQTEEKHLVYIHKALLYRG